MINAMIPGTICKIYPEFCFGLTEGFGLSVEVPVVLLVAVPCIGNLAAVFETGNCLAAWQN